MKRLQQKGEGHALIHETVKFEFESTVYILYYRSIPVKVLILHIVQVSGCYSIQVCWNQSIQMGSVWKSNKYNLQKLTWLLYAVKLFPN